MVSYSHPAQGGSISGRDPVARLRAQDTGETGGQSFGSAMVAPRGSPDFRRGSRGPVGSAGTPTAAAAAPPSRWGCGRLGGRLLGRCLACLRLVSSGDEAAAWQDPSPGPQVGASQKCLEMRAAIAHCRHQNP